MESEKRVAIMHYAPIKRTLEGESPELFAFLGSSLLADALDRSQVDVVFHGHAHGGSPRGLTASGIPVYNVCRFVQERHSGQSFYMFEM
jgi:Icc-related predicted phosphoesterase